MTGNNSAQQSSTKIQLDKIQKEGIRLSTESAKRFAYLRRELEQAVWELREKSNKNVVGTNHNDEAEHVKSLSEIRFSLVRLQLMAKSISRENCILRRLYFDSMYARESCVVTSKCP